MSLQHCSIHNSQDMELIYVLIKDQWIKKMWDIYTIKYSVMRKKEALLFETTQMDFEDISLNEISQTNTVWYQLHVESYLFLSQSHRKRFQKSGFQSLRDGENTDRLVKDYRLSALKSIRSGDLMYTLATIVDNTVLYN